MGKGNAAVRQWMSNPKRFADLFNGMVFEGEQVIRPEELEPADGETDLLLEDKNGKMKNGTVVWIHCTSSSGSSLTGNTEGAMFGAYTNFTYFRRLKKWNKD